MVGFLFIFCVLSLTMNKVQTVKSCFKNKMVKRSLVIHLKNAI